jgi:serine/threonine protein kinase
METFCGTTGYASPEMLAGRKYLGVETDIWSLGIILYTLLAGGLPFDDDNEAIMKELIIKGEYEEPDWLSDGASRWAK